MQGQDFSWEDLNTCVWCGSKFPENSHYYKQHGVTIANYYRRHFPKTDLFTKAAIEFKNLEHYYCVDFNNKQDLRKYVENLPEKKTYLSSLLTRRIEVKQIAFAPSQVELKSLGFPSIKYFNTIFSKEGGYYKLCATLNLRNRFETYNLHAQSGFNQWTNETLIIDTREQKNFKFLGKNREIGKLNYGDYQLVDQEKYGKCAVERKSLSDFIGSFGKQHDRLEAEIIRAKNDNADLIIVVEESLSNCLDFNKLPHLSKFIKTKPDYVFHNVRELLAKYDNLQFLFVRNRVEAGEKIPFLLCNWNKLKQYDLQFLYDSVYI
jgi:ERCC4 domain